MVRKFKRTIYLVFILVNLQPYPKACFGAAVFEVCQQPFSAIWRGAPSLTRSLYSSSYSSLAQSLLPLPGSISSPQTALNIYLFNSRSFSTDSRARPTYESSITEVARRTLTIGDTEPYQPVASSLQHAFHSFQYWQKHYDYKNKALIADENSRHQLFDKLLYERIEKQKRWETSKLLYPCQLDYYKKYKARDESDPKFRESIGREVEDELKSGKAFLDGHMLPVTGKTKFPMVLVNIHSKPKGEATKTIRWWAPIQEAIRSQTLGQHMQRLALSKLWDSYSHMALLVIPEGAFIDCRIGIVAPRTVPDLEVDSLRVDTDPVRKALEQAVDIKSLDKAQIQGLVETLKGASSQIYMITISDYKVFDLGAFHHPKKDSDSSTPPSPTFVQKSRFHFHPDGDWKRTLPPKGEKADVKFLWTPLEDIGRSYHLTHSGYSQMELDIVGILQERGILKEAEAKEIQKELDDHRKHWYPSSWPNN